MILVDWIWRRKLRRRFLHQWRSDGRGVHKVAILPVVDHDCRCPSVAEHIGRVVRHADELAGKTGVSVQWRDGYETAVLECIAVAREFEQHNAS